MRKAYLYTRFSTPEQAKGRSLARQTEKALQFCKEHDLSPDNTLRLSDEGLSAFHGKNISHGALGRFLQAAESGRIERGSVLIIESLDRLSRADIETAQDLFKKILKQKIDIITLSDGKQYTDDSLKDPFAVIQAILTMARANEESEIKSRRVADAWRKKRERLQVNGELLTHKIPLWLKLENGKFSAIPERVQTIQKIFDLATQGRGKTYITKQLNKQSIPSFKGGTWGTSSVQRLLFNQALIGVYQPHKIVNGKRVPDGEPIKDYFPAVIPEKDFFAIQARREAPTLHGNISKVSNLFSGLAHCAYCGSKMVLVNKGDGLKLVCGSAKAGAGCKYVSVPYAEMELLIITCCEDQFRLKEYLTEDKKKASAMQTLKRNISGSEAALQAQKARVKKLMASFADSEDTTLQAALQEMLSDCTKEIADLKKDLEQKKRELYSLENTDTGNKLHELISLKEKLSDTETRRQARNIIRDIVDRIEVYPSGLSVENTDEHGAPDRKLRFYKIKFKGLNVTYKVLMPGPDSTYILTASPK